MQCKCLQHTTKYHAQLKKKKKVLKHFPKEKLPLRFIIPEKYLGNMNGNEWHKFQSTCSSNQELSIHVLNTCTLHLKKIINFIFFLMPLAPNLCQYSIPIHNIGSITANKRRS